MTSGSDAQIHREAWSVSKTCPISFGSFCPRRNLLLDFEKIVPSKELTSFVSDKYFLRCKRPVTFKGYLWLNAPWADFWKSRKVCWTHGFCGITCSFRRYNCTGRLKNTVDTSHLIHSWRYELKAVLEYQTRGQDCTSLTAPLIFLI